MRDDGFVRALIIGGYLPLRKVHISVVLFRFVQS